MYEELSNEYLECGPCSHSSALRKSEKELVEDVKVVADQVRNLSGRFAFPVKRSEDGGKGVFPRFPFGNKITRVGICLDAFNQDAEILLDPFRAGLLIPENLSYRITGNFLA